MDAIVKMTLNDEMVNQAVTEYVNTHLFKDPVFRATITSCFTAGYSATNKNRPIYEYEVTCQSTLAALANEN